MARENKLRSLRRSDTEETTVSAMESYISQSIEEELHFDYKAITDLDEDDINNLKNYEKALLHEGKKIGQISLEIGKNLLKAREIFIKSHDKSFMDWYESLGLNKDQVSIFIGRFELSIEYPNNREKIVSLSDVAIKEVLNKKTPDELKEKVISGEIVTGKQIKEERKNISRALEKKSLLIEEAQIVKITKPLEDVQNILRKIKIKISEIDSFVLNNDGIDNEEYFKLEKIFKALNEINKEN